MLTPADARLVDGLRKRDEAAFAELMREYGASMLRVAQMYVSSRAVAEEVVQEAWLAVLKGIDRFEGRSSLKTWIFRILINRAMSRGKREKRIVPFSSLSPAEDDSQGFSAEEVRNALDISETNQRVLLHRARSKVRRALEEYMG